MPTTWAGSYASSVRLPAQQGSARSVRLFSHASTMESLPLARSDRLRVWSVLRGTETKHGGERAAVCAADLVLHDTLDIARRPAGLELALAPSLTRERAAGDR